MELFFTADTHFDHEPILSHAKRPWATVDEMNEVLVENWNREVGRNDRVFIIGDFAFKRHGRWINALHGQKVLIAGNHDSMSDVMRQQFSECHDFGVDKILHKQAITMCHYPLRSWDRMREGAWHLHGHVHQRMNNKSVESAKQYGLMVDVGVDGWDFTPVHFDVIFSLMTAKRNYLKDNGRTFKR